MPMPYMLSKGPIMSVLESIANGTTAAEVARLQQNLTGWRNNAPITSLPAFDLDQPGRRPRRRLRRRHGSTSTGSAIPSCPAAPSAPKQPAFDPANPKPTGYWKGYYGDVEGLMRETMIRAVEVSRGLAAGQDLAQATRLWPVEVFWACPHPWVEGWVTWREHETVTKNGKTTSKGQVTVIFATPSDTVNQIATDPMTPPDPPAPTLAQSPGAGAQGMWLISESDHVPHLAYKLVDVPAGSSVDTVLDRLALLVGRPAQQWTIPVPTTLREGVEPIITVELPGAHGGVVPGGLGFQVKERIP